MLRFHLHCRLFLDLHLPGLLLNVFSDLDRAGNFAFTFLVVVFDRGRLLHMSRWISFNWESISSAVVASFLLLLHWLIAWFPLRPSIFLFIRQWSALSMPVHVKPHYYFLCAISLAESSQEVWGGAGRLICVQTVSTRGWQDVAEEPNIAAQMWGSAEFPCQKGHTWKLRLATSQFHAFHSCSSQTHVEATHKSIISHIPMAHKCKCISNLCFFIFFQCNLFCTQD